MRTFDYSQEKLDRERKQLEKVEALFEQRKIAAHDDLANADHTMSIIHEAKARLNDEMERLSQLSEYVKQKDAEAHDKLEHAEELTSRLNDMDTYIKHEAENAEQQRQEMDENRIILARERVALLKERSKARSSGSVGSIVSSNNSALFREPTRSSSRGVGLMQPEIRRTLVSIKNDLNKLRKG